ncbi:AI-2E family transporter [bacterium]|jgi:predicted PurR-regulated permease PerM|nr:AI-2E family transporter [Flavobacteriaceae bacterium]MDA9073454.1 AI-2E family transporter [bacterium]MDA9338165.1 AI-2E family transporter [Flavobacteriaceae bacterium]MDB0061344.1 AI-2E family transporter [bacterium]MDB4228605.1 AI-2E family transporter [Flavobacteriaceae bacterium]|tara:strand:- start:908 stop:1996 length:1089 start_codon:yes stop_codon:yes gene_type:complete
MNSKLISNGILRAIAVLAAVLFLGYFLLLIQSVLIYIIIAAIIALIAKPMILFLRKKLKFPNTIAVVSTMVLFVSLIIGITGMFIPLVIEQGESLSLLKTKGLEENIGNLITQANEYFTSKNIDILSELQGADVFASLKSIPNLLNSIVGALGSFSVGLFSVLFISFFFMKDSKMFKSALLTLMPKGTEDRFSHSLEKINDLLSRYFIGLVIQITILFVIYTIILLVIGVSNAVVIAFLCALLNIIPYVGPLISAFLMIVLTMTSGLGQDLDFQVEILPKTVYVMIGFIIAQVVDNFASQPIIFSKTTKSHPLEIFLIIIIGGLLAGPLGMIIAVPSYTVLKVILKEFISDNKIVSSLTKDI